ncbi:hypothetical protein [Streptomyces adustus]
MRAAAPVEGAPPTSCANSADAPRWTVTGLAGAYAASYATGLLITALLLRRRLEGRLDGKRLCRTYGKLTASALTAGTLDWFVARSCSNTVTSITWAPAPGLAAGGLTMSLVFVLLARILKISELRSLLGLG